MGVFPNTLDRADPPQRSSRIIGNQIYANKDPDAPALDSYPLIGVGILLWGGSDNVVAESRIRDHFGIVAHPHVVEPSGNEVRDNRVNESGQADLVLGQPAGGGNRFHDNAFETSLPPRIESDANDGSAEVTGVFSTLERQVERGTFPAGDWREQPVPGDQPSMRDPEAPPKPASRDISWETPQRQTEGYEMGG